MRAPRSLFQLVTVAAMAVVIALTTGGWRHGGQSALPDRLGPSKGKQFFVDGQRGHDSSPGSIRRPWRSIAKAWRTVPAGSTIYVRAGTYATQTVLSGRTSNRGNPITLRAYPREVVVLTDTTHAGSAVRVSEASGVRIRGFRITNPTGDGIKVTNSANIEIVANSVFGCGNQGILVGGSGSSGQTYSRNVQIWSNRIYANGKLGSARHNHGIYYGFVDTDDDSIQRGAVDGLIANNVLFDQPTGYELQVGPQANSVVVTNNTFIAASSADPHTGSAIVIWGAGHRFSTSDVLVVNNAFAFNGNKAVQGSGHGSGNVVRSNLAYGNSGGDFAPVYDGTAVFALGPGNVTGLDPQFVDRSAHDFRPRAGSPLVDHADPAYSPPTDATGRRRTSKPDIGALEYIR